MNEEPKLFHLLVIVGYQLLLLLSLLQAAGKQEPYSQTGMIGAYRLHLGAASMPQPWQRQPLTVSAQGAGCGRLSALILPTSASGATQHAAPVSLAAGCKSPGVYELALRPLPPGRWSLRLVLQTGPATANATLLLRIAVPSAPPAWLMWRMGLFTLALLLYATWVHNRRDAKCAYTLALER